VLAKIMVLVFIVIFIQKRPQGHVCDEGPERRSMTAVPLGAAAPSVPGLQQRAACCWAPRAGPA
jgi:hypothetical protein